MYFILDENLNTAGVLDNSRNKATPFYDDLRTWKIADEQGKVWTDTLELSSPYGYVETEMLDRGYHLLTQGNDGYYYCFRIYNWSDDTYDSGNGKILVKKVECFNLCIWDLYHIVLDKKTFTKADIQSVFSYILTLSGWQLGNVDFNGTIDEISFDFGTTAQAALDSAISAFNVEVRARVEIVGGKIVRKIIDIVEKLGESQGYRAEYGRNLKGIERVGEDTELYTKLHVVGGTDSDGNQITIASVNGGKTYLVDDEANDLYNAGKPYLVGYVQNDDITDPTKLKDWGQTQLEYYNHPRYTYVVDLGYLGFAPNIGDYFRVVNFEFTPELTINARVIAIEESQADPSKNVYTLGEFQEIVVVTPADIWELQAKASQAYQEAQKAKSYKVEYFLPDGADFDSDEATKRIIIRVYSGTENITNSLTKDSFVWEKINPDGTHDLDWEATQKGVGNVIVVDKSVTDCTIRCNVDDGASDPIIFADETDAAYFLTFPMQYTGGTDGVNTHVVQYAQVDIDRGHVYYTQKYNGTNYRPSDYATTEQFEISRCTIDGQFIDSMICIHGGHGSHFGIEYAGNKMWIWSPYYDPTNKKYHVVKFPYQPGKVMDWKDSSIVDMLTFGSTSYRVNLDVNNGYVLLVNGTQNPTFYVCRKSDVENKVFKPLFTAKGTDIDYFGTDQTYQSACLDYPYVYLTSGGVDDQDQRCMYCFDIRSKSIVYRIVYTFDKGTINPIGIYDECETISYYYDSNGKKWVIQGFGWGNEDPENSQHTNQLFRLNEHQRGD